MDEFKTGLTYYEEMVKHHCLWDSNYPECPERFSAVLRRCQELGLVERCKRIASREANDEEILTKHNPELISLLKQCENKTVEELEKICSRYDSIYICSETFKLAKIAAGSTINLVKEICEGNIQNGMAIVRPPGHHAMKSAYCGYCFFNNVALAADYALKNFNLNRILIVDWDVHHGQATQQMFYEDGRVLYFSIHRYEYGTFWPNLRESDYDFIGQGAGKGYNFNIPLNKTGLGNAEYLSIFHDLLLPVTLEYNPDLIIISAGYDAAIGCPEFEPQLVLISGGFDSALGDEKGEMKVTPACYAHLVKSLSHLANGKVAVVLEGGYFLTSLAEGAALSLRALLGDPTPVIDAVGVVDANLLETIRNVIYSHREHWNCFKIYDTFKPSEGLSQRNCHFPAIKFDFHGEPLEIFPTQNAYPVQSTETKRNFENILKQLRKDTDLKKPKHKCLLISNSNQVSDKVIERVSHDSAPNEHSECSNTNELLSSLKTKNFEWKESSLCSNNLNIITNKYKNDSDISILQSLIKAANYIFNDITGTAIIDYLPISENFEVQRYTNIFSDYVSKTFGVKRILLVDIHFGSIETAQNFGNSDYKILIFNINDFVDPCSSEKYNIRVNWNNQSAVGNFEYVTLWLKTVLPICYQFQPEIILMFLNPEKLRNSTSPELSSYLVHWLNVLANGKLICVNKHNEFDKSAITHICRTLTQNEVPRLKIDVYKDLNSVKKLNESLEKEWSLNSFVKFPEEYCL